MIDRKTDRNCDTGGFELIYRQPPLASPPYIGLNLSLEGHAYTRSGVRMSSNSSYQPPSAFAMATARSTSPTSAVQQSQAVSTSSMSASQVGLAGKQMPAKRGYVDLPPARIATVTANAAADEGTSALPLNFLPVLRYRNARNGGLANGGVSGPKKALPPVGGAGDTRTTLRQSLTVRKLARSEEEDGSSSGTRHAQEEPLPHFVQLHKFQSLLRSKRVRSVLGTSNSYPAGAKEISRALSTSTSTNEEAALWGRPEPPRRSSSVLEVQVSRLDPRLRVEHRPSSSVERLPALDERASASASAPSPQPPLPPPHRPPSASAAAAASRSSSAAVSRPLSTVAVPEPVPMGLLRASRSHQSSASRANVPPPDSL